jgi:glycogen synthase
MVVNNAVTGDSRVQRCATAAARGGWDVTVLGRSPDGRRREREGPGGARTVLLPVRQVMAGRGMRRTLRRHRLVHHRLAERDRVAGHRGRPWSHGGWRVLDPWLADYELAIADEIEALRPALIHAHDRHPVPAVARSVASLRAAGHDVAWVLDAHEDVAATAARGAGGPRGWARRRMVNGEQDEWIREADAVVTVSSDLAHELARRHRLAERPTVVQNAPEPADEDVEVLGLRDRLGLAPDSPLLVYAGSCAPARGVETAVDALPFLDALRGHTDSHLALVASPSDPYVPALLGRAATSGTGNRVHRVDYVPADEVVALLRSADVGLVPLLHRPNHEIALVTKYLEYVHAGVPVVCSEVRTMARFTRQHGVGEVFVTGDPADLARAVAEVLLDPASYRDRIAGSAAVRATAWPAQAERLLALYDRVAPVSPPDPNREEAG